MEQKKSQIRVGVAAIVYNDQGEILIGLRTSAHGHGTWGFPGGHQDMGESPEDCARREAMEETGIEIGNLKPLGFTSDIFSPEKHYVTLFIEADHTGGAVRVMEPDKAQRWEWRAWDDLPRPLFLGIENLLQSPFAARLRVPQTGGRVAA